MEVIYSINARLGGGGIGNTALHAVKGPARQGLLKRVICSSAVPGVLDPAKIRSLGLAGRMSKRLSVLEKSGRLNNLVNEAFSLWSSRVLESCDVLHCWSNLGRTLEKAKSQGALTVVEAMMHPKPLRSVLQKEETRWGVRSTDIPTQSQYRQLIEEIEMADLVAVPSEFNRRTHVESGVPPEKIRVVPYGVDLKQFHRDPTRERPNCFVALFVGQFSLRKGAPYLMEAWRNLGWKGAELWILGSISAELSPLMGRWKDLPGVKFLGHRPDPQEVFRMVDLFVFPSLGEGSALVTYEAMASGLAMVLTENVGSIAQAGEAIFCKPGDIDDLGEALEVARSDEDFRVELGLRARERVREFSWESYGDRLVQMYRERV